MMDFYSLQTNSEVKISVRYLIHLINLMKSNFEVGSIQGQPKGPSSGE